MISVIKLLILYIRANGNPNQVQLPLHSWTPSPLGLVPSLDRADASQLQEVPRPVCLERVPHQVRVLTEGDGAPDERRVAPEVVGVLRQAANPEGKKEKDASEISKRTQSLENNTCIRHYLR